MLRALLTIGAVQVLTMLVMLVRTKALATTLGPELVGIMAVLDKLLAVVSQTVSLSLPFAALRFLPAQWTAGPAEYRALFVRMRNVLVSLALLATAGALAVSFLRPALWGAALYPYRDVLIAAILGLPVVGLVPFLQNAIAGRLQQNRSMLVAFLHAVVLTVAVGGLWWGGLVGYYAVYAALGTGLVIGLNGLALQGTGTHPHDRMPTAPLWYGLPAPIWRFSGALLTLTFIAPYAALFVHYRLLSHHGAETAGWMQAAIGVSLSVRAVLGSAHAVFLTPNVNRGGTPDDRMSWANDFQSTLCLLAGLTVPALLLFPGMVVNVLYSSEFSPGAAFTVLFVLGEVVGLLSGTYQSLIVALDHMAAHVAMNLVAQLLVMLVAYQLVGSLGILGAGVSAMVAPVFLFAATMTLLYHRYGLRMPGRVLARASWLLVGIALSGVMGVFLTGATPGVLAAKLGAYALVVGGFAYSLTDHERRRVRVVLAEWGIINDSRT